MDKNNEMSAEELTRISGGAGGNEKKKKYVCQFCANKIFSTKDELKTHMKKAHPKESIVF